MTESESNEIDSAIEEADIAAAWLQERFEKNEQVAAAKEAIGEDSTPERKFATSFKQAWDSVRKLQLRVKELESSGFSAERAQNPSKIGARIGNIEDLPEEIRDQLKTAITDELENQILEVIKEDYQETASVDEILVGLYRRFQRIEDREQLSRKLYRMTRKELIRALPKRRGIYEIV